MLTVFFSVLLLTSCYTELDFSNIEEGQFTGEELFSGIYFLSGNVVNEVPQLTELQDEVLSFQEASTYFGMIDSLRETAISSIDSLSPNFFPEF